MSVTHVGRVPLFQSGLRAFDSRQAHMSIEMHGVESISGFHVAGERIGGPDGEWEVSCFVDGVWFDRSDCVGCVGKS